MLLTKKEFHHLRDLVYRKTRIHMGDSKIVLLSNRIRKRLKALNLADFSEYIRFIEHTNSANELEQFLEVVTTNETYFHRDANDFDVLIQKVVPEIVAAKSSDQASVTLFSAGSSTGEEAYELAMYMDSNSGLWMSRSFRVIGMDVSDRCIAVSRRGCYSQTSVEALPSSYRRRYFDKCGEERGETILQINASLKDHVEFVKGELFNAELPLSDVIFCRNVMIYFQPDDKKKLIHRFYNALKPGGFLFLGSAESLMGMDEMFHSEYQGRNVYYRKLGATKRSTV